MTPDPWTMGTKMALRQTQFLKTTANNGAALALKHYIAS